MFKNTQHVQGRPPQFANQQPYMYPPRPYPPSVPPYPQSAEYTSHPYGAAQSMGFPGQMPKQKKMNMKSLMNGFVDQEGQIDVQKTMATVDTAMKTYQQVTPMIKQLATFFITRP
ncbi:YppG family protein [Geomicrobium sp. JCM 19055]|nr:YppG family protein [Geomicrobium sp. JCM 19055]GAK00499.1 hypothetical protein JCM19055_3590 [Geomicrobium sp. JCM 19055]